RGDRHRGLVEASLRRRPPACQPRPGGRHRLLERPLRGTGAGHGDRWTARQLRGVDHQRARAPGVPGDPGTGGGAALRHARPAPGAELTSGRAAVPPRLLAHNRGMSGGVEREIKLSADAGHVLPDLSDLTARVVEDSGPEPQETTYWDSDQLELVRQGFGLRPRRRLDRPGDPGIWTLKTPGRVEGDRMVRGEHELRAEGSTPPAELLSLIPEAVDPSVLHPVAVLRATRRVLTLGRSTSGERGSGTVEVMDDTV